MKYCLNRTDKVIIGCLSNQPVDYDFSDLIVPAAVSFSQTRKAEAQESLLINSSCYLLREKKEEVF